MQLISDLKSKLFTEESYFRSYLIKEDIARLERLLVIAAASPSLEAFQRDGLLIGWTPDDTRTFELKPVLDQLMAAIWAFREAPSAAAEAAIARAWAELEAVRMDRLVGCLARVPPPLD